MRKLTVPVWEVNRECSTNQRIQFDISTSGKFLLSGSTKGKLHFWGLSQGGSMIQEAKVVEAHRSASNAASIHPFAPICASGSGQRVFPTVADSDSEDTLTATPVSDNSLTLWTAFEYWSVQFHLVLYLPIRLDSNLRSLTDTTAPINPVYKTHKNKLVTIYINNLI